MRVLATGGTWGISGPTFLEFYAALAIAAFVATVLTRRFLAYCPVPKRSALDHPGNPEDVAYVRLGPELAVLTALSAMYLAGSITSSGHNRVRASGTVGPEATELEQAIHLAAQQPLPRAKLAGAPLVAEALGGIERRLIDAGLLLGPAQRRRIRRTGWALWAVVAVGAIRVIADAVTDRPVSFFLVALTGVLAVSAMVLSGSAPRYTDRGVAEQKRLRAAYSGPPIRPPVYVDAGGWAHIRRADGQIPLGRGDYWY